MLADCTSRTLYPLSCASETFHFVCDKGKKNRGVKRKKMRHEHGTKPTTKCVKCQRERERERELCGHAHSSSAAPTAQPPFLPVFPLLPLLVACIGICVAATIRGNFLILNLICWLCRVNTPLSPLPLLSCSLCLTLCSAPFVTYS